MTAALLRERISPLREIHKMLSTDIELVKTDINSLILLSRSFEMRLDSTDEQWKRQFKQNAFLIESVSELKSRLDRLDAEKLVAQRVWKFQMICVVLCATIVWTLHNYLEYPHTESTARTLT
jgi:hypothetical protein